MRYLPLHVDLQGRTVLVIGGGEIARRKVELLLRAGASIHLIAPEVIPALRGSLENNVIDTTVYTGLPPGLTPALVVAATDDAALNEAVSVDARTANIPVNVVDAPDLSTVVFPAIIDRDPVLVSVGSSATSPVLTRSVREQIEALLPDGLSRLATYLGDRRRQLKAVLPDLERRRRHTEWFLNSPGSRAVETEDLDRADEYLLQPSAEVITGEVFLVGAGPGDPDLLTLKALQLIQRADVVLYDNLVSPKVLDRVRRDASMEFVGKRSGYRSTSQEDINELLVRLALEGHRVL